MLITHGAYLDPTGVASGNSVRAYFLALGLAQAGIEVVHVYPADLGAPRDPAPRPGIRVRTYADADTLASLIAQESPAALLIGYWELIESLPEDLDLPIVLDVVAPRILEAMYQEHLDLPNEVRRTLACYRRADRFLVGNQRQASFLLAWLILAGIDCRGAAPIDVLPISVEGPAETDEGAAEEVLRLVSGGVSWPWRRTQDWFDHLVRALRRHGRGTEELALFSGSYVYAADAGGAARSGSPESARADGPVRDYPLLPYGEMQRFLRTRCHIGVELADENPERWHSQSFRAMEFLRNGLPLICNAYMELAVAVRDYDAGWVVEGQDELDGVIREIIAHPERVAEKSANAQRLVAERFHYANTIEPLLAFLRSPRRIPLGEPLLGLGLVEADTAMAPEATAPVEPDRPERADTGRGRSPVALLAPGLRGLKAVVRPLAKPVLKGLIRAVGSLRRSDAVILISRADIRPANHGAAVKIDRTAWGLSYSVGAVYLVSEQRATYWLVRKGVFEERRFPRWLRGIGPDEGRVRDFLAASGIPRDDAFLYIPVADWSFIVRTLYLALKTGARTYQAEFPAYGRASVWARDLLGGRALLVEHNIEYQRLADQTKDLPPHGYAMLRKIELAWCERSDAVITVSEADRQRLLADGIDPKRVHVIPHGVDLDQFERAETLDLHALFDIPRDRRILVYHGIYLYPPNLEAMEVMAAEILPRLERAGVRATVLAIGAYPPARALHPQIRFTGPVDAVAPYLKAADLAVVPLQQGGGTRMKILDYFAAGLAVVSTAKGAEGIPVEPDRHLRIADEPDAFAQAVADLLADEETRRRLGEAARAFVRPLDWRAIAARYLELV
nr:glycosyltransferase [Thiocystis violacea]